jgi:hypothetical protein
MRDPISRGHSERVATYASGLAQALGLSRSRNRRVQLAAMLHNIGLLFLSTEEASRAPGDPDLDTKRIELACQLLDKTQGMTFLVPAVRHHRERFDGKGYPDGLKGEDIPLEARIISVANDFDVTLTTAAEAGEDLPTKDAVGRQFKAALADEEYGLVPINVIGVVRDSRFRSIREPIDPIMFRINRFGYGQMLVRYNSPDPERVRGDIERIWKRIATDAPFAADFSDDIVAKLYKAEQARTKTFAGFALLAVNPARRAGPTLIQSTIFSNGAHRARAPVHTADSESCTDAIPPHAAKKSPPGSFMIGMHGE